MDHHNHDHHDHYHDHEHSLKGELFHHLPYAIFSVAFALIILSFVTLTLRTMTDQKTAQSGANMLFHSFHFMHIVFAATGTLITFAGFAKVYFRQLLVGILTPVIFCTLSDSVLPYLGGRALGVNMSFHLCFFTELANVLPFLFVGIINGFIMSKHSESHQKYIRFFPTLFIFLSVRLLPRFIWFLMDLWIGIKILGLFFFLLSLRWWYHVHCQMW